MGGVNPFFFESISGPLKNTLRKRECLGQFVSFGFILHFALVI